MSNKENQFNIKETVNKNIQKRQFPWFANYSSMIGWCSINYPSSLPNAISMEPPPPKNWDYDLEHFFQNPRHQAQQGLAGDCRSTLKKSAMTLATTKHSTKAAIFEQVASCAQQYSQVRPLRCVIGPDLDKQFSLKSKKIGEVTYEPVFESQEMRHKKKLPNLILNEENLMEIASEELFYLNLENNSSIPNELISKLGHFAPNLRQLHLTSTQVTDEVLTSLCGSLPKLTHLDISKCKALTSRGVGDSLKFLADLEQFRAEHNSASTTDQSLAPLRKAKKLQSFSISFCKQVSSEGLLFLKELDLKELSLANVSSSLIKSDFFQEVISRSQKSLIYLDLAFNKQTVTDKVAARIAHCTRLQTLVLSGCSLLTDEAISYFDKGDKTRSKYVEGFQYLETLKLGGVSNLGDNLGALIKKCQSLEFVEVNNLQKLTDAFVEHLKKHPRLAWININMTPGILEAKLQELRETKPSLRVIRHLCKVSDPNQKVLRMPLPSEEARAKRFAGPKKTKK